MDDVGFSQNDTLNERTSYLLLDSHHRMYVCVTCRVCFHTDKQIDTTAIYLVVGQLNRIQKMESTKQGKRFYVISLCTMSIVYGHDRVSFVHNGESEIILSTRSNNSIITITSNEQGTSVCSNMQNNK